MKSNTYELHNYADLSMSESQETRKRKANNTSNSRRNEKYSLRQKRRNASRQPAEPALLTELPTLAAPAATVLASSSSTTSRSKAAPKAKTKAAPLSKYRRKTANARERTRMREINTAFEQLRHCVPQTITGEEAANASEKLTKITTLRLAMKYIHMLNESLEHPDYEHDFIVDCLRESASREAHVSTEQSQETDAELEPELEPERAPVKAKKPASKSSGIKKTTPVKRAAAKQPKQPIPLLSSPESCYASSSIGSPVSCAAGCSPSSAYASLSSVHSSDNGSATLDADSLLGMHAFSELNTLLLESDGESLQLSDHCLSPGYHSLLTPHGSVLPSRCDLPISVSSLDKADVELSLRLLDSSADSFDFGSDQQPSACISPLASLDSFNPFNDLLHTDFPEPSALDLFLT